MESAQDWAAKEAGNLRALRAAEAEANRMADAVEALKQAQADLCARAIVLGAAECKRRMDAAGVDPKAMRPSMSTSEQTAAIRRVLDALAG